MLKIKDDLNCILLSTKSIDVLNKSITIRTKLPEMIVSHTKVPKTKFVSGLVKNLNLSKIIGDLYHIDCLKLNQTYETDLENVAIIQHVDDKIKLIGNSSSK